MKKKSSPTMIAIRKWSRILHRDIGFFFVGTTIIYGLSGLALNHMNDWDPSYSIDIKQIKTELNLSKSDFTKVNLDKFLEETNTKEDYKNHYYPDEKTLKVFLKGNSSIVLDTKTGIAEAELVRKRLVFYEANLLHYNPTRWWTWFSDIFAGALILFAITALFMIKGKKGAWGRGGVYIILGIIIPIIFLIYL